MRMLPSLLLFLLPALAAGGAVTFARTPAPTAQPPGAPRAGAPSPTPPPDCVRAWEMVPSANVTNYDNVLRAVAIVSPQNIWAVGDHSTNIQNESRTVILHWDGAQWTVVPSTQLDIDFGTGLTGVAAINSNDVWAVGGHSDLTTSATLIAHWDGQAWSLVPSPNAGTNDALSAVTAIAPNDVWAVGHTWGGLALPLILHWDGSQWSIVPTPNPGGYSTVYGVSAVAANDVWAVGGGTAAYSMHWDGSHWSLVPVPAPGTSSTLHAVSALAANDVWAVGNYQSGSVVQALLVHWDGTSWSQVPSPPLQSPLLWSIAARDANDVWAAGYDGASIARTLTLHWDGVEWARVPSPSVGPSLLFGLAPDPAGNMWAVGGYSPLTERTLVLRYQPTCLTVTPTPTVTPTRTATLTPTPTRTPSPTSMFSPTPLPCGLATVLNEGFESGTLGTFESEVATCVPGGCGWQPVTGTVASGLYAAFAPDPPQESEQYIVMRNPVTIPANAGQPTFQFRHRFAFEPPDFDGGVLRYSTNGGASWQGVPSSSFLAGGYNGTVNFTNPFMGGPAWISSTNGVFIQSVVDLQPFRGQPIMFSFMMGTDHSIGAPGWWIDDLSITFTTPCPTATATPSPCASCATATPTVCPVQFNDVPPGSTFYAYVRCLACAGIVGGYPCGGLGELCPGQYYRPNNNVTRGQVSKIVAESAGFADPVPSSQQTFEDVPPGSTFWVWIERLSTRGIIGGYPCGGSFEPCVAPTNRPYFRPNNNVTRGQLSKIASGAAQWTETPTGQTFEDVPPGSTFYLPIERTAARGIIGGYPCGGPFEPCLPPANRPYFRSQNPATRGQMSKIAAGAFLPACR